MMTLERRRDLITVLKPYFLPKRLHSTRSYFIKAIDHTFYGFTGVITHLGCCENTRKACKSESVVYCLSNVQDLIDLPPTTEGPTTESRTTQGATTESRTTQGIYCNKCFAQNTIYNRNELLKHPVCQKGKKVLRPQKLEL